MMVMMEVVLIIIVNANQRRNNMPGYKMKKPMTKKKVKKAKKAKKSKGRMY